KVIAYKVSANVTLKLKDFSKVAPILSQLADTDVRENQSINYTLEDIDAAKGGGVGDASRRARASADAIARASGRAVGELSYASVDTFENQRIYGPRPMVAKAAMAAA